MPPVYKSGHINQDYLIRFLIKIFIFILQNITSCFYLRWYSYLRLFTVLLLLQQRYIVALWEWMLATYYGECRNRVAMETGTLHTYLRYACYRGISLEVCWGYNSRKMFTGHAGRRRSVRLFVCICIVSPMSL